MCTPRWFISPCVAGKVSGPRAAAPSRVRSEPAPGDPPASLCYPAFPSTQAAYPGPLSRRFRAGARIICGGNGCLAEKVLGSSSSDGVGRVFDRGSQKFGQHLTLLFGIDYPVDECTLRPSPRQVIRLSRSLADAEKRTYAAYGAFFPLCSLHLRING